MRHLRGWWRALCLATWVNYVLNSDTSRSALDLPLRAYRGEPTHALNAGSASGDWFLYFLKEFVPHRTLNHEVGCAAEDLHRLYIRLKRVSHLLVGSEVRILLFEYHFVPCAHDIGPDA